MNLSDINYPLRWPREEIAGGEGDLHEDNPDFTVERLETVGARIVAAAEMEALARVLEPVSSQAAAFVRRRGRVGGLRPPTGPRRLPAGPPIGEAVIAPEPPYKSAHRRLSDFERLTGRDSRGRFLPKWSGSACDWWGCEDPIEAPRRRFCAAHRRAHGQRLLGQLHPAEGMAGGSR